MPGEKRHASGLLEKQDTLGANWKSAQCVASLYDSYIQLQQENEQLREDARQNELQLKQQQVLAAEETQCSQLEQEIRLLRSEKLRLEEAHRLELQKLEARAASTETQHQQLVVKYQERFEFDPLEGKRAAMAVKTMQNTLQNVILEKEELGIRYGELKEQYRKFHIEQTEIVKNLKEKVNSFDQQRVRQGQQRVVNALAKWSTDKLQSVWKKWRAMVKQQRLEEENAKMVAGLERQVDARVAKIRGNQAAILAMKLLQQSARRTFVRWRDLTRRNVERRRRGVSFAEERDKRSVRRVMIRWRMECQQANALRAGALKIERLLACHSRRWGMRTWTVHTFRLALTEKDRKLDAFNETMELHAKTIMDLEAALDESWNARREMQTRREEENARYADKIEKHRAAELMVRQKLGRFFTKQSDRQLLKDIVREWKIIATYLQGVKQRSDLVRAKLRILKLRRSVSDWHCSAHQSYKKRVRTQQIFGRMRQIGVLRCFNSWKERVRETKARKSALLYAVNRIRNRGVARCFSQWAAFRAQRLSLRCGIEVMIQCAMKQQVFFMFSAWKERVTELKIAAQVRQQQLIQKAWENRLDQAKRDLIFQRECFTRWREVVLQRQRRDVMVKRCVARLKNGSLAKTLGSWRDFVESRKAQRELVRRWIGRLHTGVLQRAWVKWQRQIVLKEQQLLMARVQGERDAQLKQLETEFDEYRKTQQSLLEQAMRTQKAQECILQETKDRLKEESKRAQRFAGAVEILCSTRERGSTLARYFKAWQKIFRQSVRNCQAVQVFLTTLDTHKTRSILAKWRQFTLHRRQLKTVFRTAQSCFSRWWQIQCFSAWKEVRRRSRAVHVFSVLFARNSEFYAIREVFTEWRKMARKNLLLRQTMEKIWLGSVHAKMRQQFTHWIEVTKTEAAKEQLEKRNAALTAMRAKMWWKQSVSTMRFCFLEWKGGVEARKKCRLAERKLIVFQQTRLARLCFSSWAEFVAKEERKQRFARWLRKVERRKQQRAMTVWKMLLIRNQIRDLQELKELRNVQQGELQLQREEISSLEKTVAETKRRLVDGNDASKAQYLTEYKLMAKYFNSLKFKVSMKRYQQKTVYLCQKNVRRRHLTELFSSWCSLTQICRAVKLLVDQKAKRCHDALTRTIVRHWHFMTYQRRVIRQKQLKLQQRVREHILKSNFAEWRRSIHREMIIASAMDKLEILARRLKLKNSLLWWHQKCLQERNRAHQEREKHKKIMQFLMGRQESGLVRTFHSWKEITWSKQATRLHAEQRYTNRCQAILANCWKSWHTTVQAMKLQRESIRCMQVVVSRYYYRSSLSRWRRYQFMIQIASLQCGNEKLTNQVAESSRRLQTTSMSVDQLSTELMQLQDKLEEAETRSSAVSLKVASQETKGNQQLTCLRALSKILLKRTVSRDVSGALSLWKSKHFDIQKKHRALVSVANIRQRRKRLFAFWLWKVKTLRWRQLKSLEKLWGRTDLLTIMQRWRKFSTIQAKLRYFLTKRCLLSNINRGLPISIAFRLWKTKSAEFTALQLVVTLQVKLRNEQDSASTHLRGLALGKWCWIAYHHRLRQMRAFFSRCYANSTKNNARRHRLVIEEIQQTSEAAIMKVKEQSEARVREEIGAISAAEEQLTTGVSFQALQTLIRRLFQPTTVRDLFVSVSTTFAQVVHGSGAILFLFDPSSNELWTQREGNQLIQVPASLGIAGSTLASGSTLIIADVTADPRFHPMVDQFVMSGLRQDEATSTLAITTARPNVLANKPTAGMVSSALVSTDGAVYGVLQVVFPTSNLATIDRRILFTQTQLYSKTCCFYVEQIVFEMLRNCRDRVRARAPDKFIRLFKQNRNWRKYYAVIERKAADMESKLRDVLEEREQLIQSKMELQKRHQQAKDKLESNERNTKDVSKLVVDWKRKLAKWQKVLDEKDDAIAEKTSELKKVEKEFERYRRERRSKELRSVLNSPSPTRRGSITEEDDETKEKSQAVSNRGQLSILRADQTRLRSQLVRAEADNLLLVKAISIARTQHGELPKTIQAEVTRVATRISRKAPPEA